jgi:hypothetical protein
MFLSDEVSAILDSEGELKARLERVCDLLFRKCGAKICFCEVFSSRWSYFAGLDGVVVPEKRIVLNERFGIIAENFDLNDTENIEVIDILKQKAW